MNLLEAVKSGKSFKRPEWETWHKEIVNYNSGIALTDKENNAIFLNKQDVLAEDWIVKEELLPCPFRGETVKYLEGWVGVDCPTLDCIFHMHEKAVPVCKDKFLKSWNNRRFIVGKW